MFSLASNGINFPTDHEIQKMKEGKFCDAANNISAPGARYMARSTFLTFFFVFNRLLLVCEAGDKSLTLLPRH